MEVLGWCQGPMDLVLLPPPPNEPWGKQQWAMGAGGAMGCGVGTVPPCYYPLKGEGGLAPGLAEQDPRQPQPWAQECGSPWEGSGGVQLVGGLHEFARSQPHFSPGSELARTGGGRGDAQRLRPIPAPPISTLKALPLGPGVPSLGPVLAPIPLGPDPCPPPGSDPFPSLGSRSLSSRTRSSPSPGPDPGLPGPRSFPSPGPDPPTRHLLQCAKPRT